MSARMKAAQISKPGGDWELIERDITEPDAGQVRVKIEACACAVQVKAHGHVSNSEIIRIGP